MFSFEFDEWKSQTNLEKHGIDFVQAQEFWSDQYLIEIPAKNIDEPRFLVIGHHTPKWKYPDHFCSSFSR